MSATSRRRRERLDRHRAARKRRLLRPLLLVAGLAALVLVGGYVLIGNLPKGDSLASGSNNVKGLASAPVEIENWSDFQCPACKMFAEGVERQLGQSLIPEGQVRLVFRQMPILGEESVQAAAASECAAEQGQFWAYHDRLYAEQRGRQSGAFSKANLKRFGAGLGLDQASFDRCVDGDLAVARVGAEGRAGQQKGVQRTPTLFVNGRKIEGVPTWEMLRQAIDGAAALVPVPGRSAL